MAMPPDCRGCGLRCPEFGWHRARRTGTYSDGRQTDGPVLALLGERDPLASDEVEVCAACATLAVLGLHPRIRFVPGP